MKAQIKLDEGQFTLNILGEFVEVVKSSNDETVCSASRMNMHFVDKDEKIILIHMLTAIVMRLVRNGYLNAAKDVRLIIRGMELGFNF